MIPELYVLRHGETVWNLEGRLQGALNSPLTETGRAHALQQRAVLARCDLRGVDCFCSPQGRAVETAGLAVAPLVAQITTEPALREIGVGDWAGKTRAAVVPPGAWDDTPAAMLDLYELAPGGEGFDRLEARCAAFLAGLERPAILVTHGITSRMLRVLALGRPRGDMAEIGGGQGVVYHIAQGVQKRLG